MYSCSNFNDLNTDRYAITEVSPAALIQTITFATQSKILSTSYNLTSQLMQHAITKSVTDIETSTYVYNYECTIAQSRTFWDLYVQKGHAEAMIAEARKDGNAGLEGVGLILRTYVMQILTDVYGDVPYFEAGLMPVQPDNIQVNLKYDSQKEIYRDMFMTLEKANTLLKGASNFTQEMDKIYLGKVASWRKLGNTLYLRLLMRASLKLIEEDGGMVDLGEEYGSFDVRAKIAEIYSENMDSSGETIKNTSGKYPIFSSVEDRAFIQYNVMSQAYYTPFHTSTSFTQMVACKTLVDKMAPRNESDLIITVDPRYCYYFSQKYKGLPVQQRLTYVSEYLKANSVASYAYDGTYGNLKDGTSYAFMNYSEPLFIFAEASSREWIPGGTALTRKLCLRACEVSIEEWNPEDRCPKVSKSQTASGKDIVPCKSDYMAYLETLYSPSLDKEMQLEFIMTQKWIASFWYGVEAWSDYRRTGFPILRTDGPAALNRRILCTRMTYPSTEPYHNGNCYYEAVNGWLKGSDDMLTDVWFADTNESKQNRRYGRN